MLLANTGRIRSNALAFALLALQFCASACQPDTAHNGPPAHELGDSIAALAYPRLQHVGEGRVYGEDGTHIVWEAFATAELPSVVVAYYHAAFSRAGAAGTYSFEADEHGGGIWRLQADGKVVAYVNVLPVEAPGLHQELGDRLARSANTVVTVSRRW